MFTTRIAVSALLAVIAWSSLTSAHGKERHFDTIINDRDGPAFDTGGSPAFTLMLIESSSRALLDAADGGQPEIARKQASRLSELVAQLRRRSEGAESPLRERLTESNTTIEQRVLRIGVAAEAADSQALRLEVAELDRLVSFLRGILRESKQP